MKKIPTMFKRLFDERTHHIVGITDKFTNPECERALKEGTPFIKWDGACCAVINGEFYKRYDAKRGKTPPEGAIPCCDPDPITGHWPHWVKVGDGPEDRWFREAFENTFKGTYMDFFLDETKNKPSEVFSFEAVGPHFQGNPHNLAFDYLIPHRGYEGGLRLNEIPRTFDEVKCWLYANKEEGLVYWLDGQPVCKIKRHDFGFEWPIKKEVK